MRNDKITITYKTEVERTIEAYPPKSKYLLFKNAVTCIVLAVICSLCTYGVYVLDEDKDLLCHSLICFMVCCLFPFVFILIDDWLHGRNYKEAVFIVKQNTTKEEREKFIEECNTQKIT